MLESDKDIKETIRDVSFGIVSEIAPEESDFFYEISDAYFTNPELLKNINSGDDPVGFGIEGVIEMVSPATIGIVSTVITYIATEIFGAAKGALTDELKNKIKSLFDKDKLNNKDKGTDISKNNIPEKENTVALTSDQLKQIRDKAIEEGLALKLSNQKATELANALIASIVTA